MTETLLTIKKADLDAITGELKALRQLLDRIDMKPKPRYIPVKEYAALISRSECTVRRNINKLDTIVEAGVTLVRNPDSV